MTFDQFLNRVHLSGLKKIIAACIAVCVLLLAYVAAFSVRQAQNKSLYANFVAAYNEGNPALYLAEDSLQTLTKKPVGELPELVMTALIQAAQQEARLNLPDNEDIKNFKQDVTVTAQAFKASDIVPLVYKELNAEDSSLKETIIALAKEPANEETYQTLKTMFKAWLEKAKLSKKEVQVRLQSSIKPGFTLPGLGKYMVSLQPSDLDLLSGELLKALQAEGEQLTELIKKVSNGTEPKSKETTIEPSVSQTEPTIISSDTESTVKITETKPSMTVKETAKATVPSVKPSASVTKPSSSKAEFKPHLENNKLPQTTVAPKANSKVPAIGKYYQVKKQDNIYDLAEQAYAAKHPDFADNPDKYIDLVIQANKLPVRKDVVYLREKQVIYFPQI